MFASLAALAIAFVVDVDEAATFADDGDKQVAFGVVRSGKTGEIAGIIAEHFQGTLFAIIRHSFVFYFRAEEPPVSCLVTTVMACR